MNGEDFGARLRAMRREKKRTKASLAIQSGVSLRALTYWEAGEHLSGLPELESVAEALGLTLEERRELIALLPTGKADKIVRAAPAWAEVEAPPGLGDMIRALRWRKRFSREQAAAALGVHRATLSRWEMSQTAPDEETRMRLCDLFGAAPEERAVLLVASSAPPLWNGAPPTLEACRKEAARLEVGCSRGADPLFDLSAYLLTGTLWNMAARQPQARPVLAQVYAARALFSCLQGDNGSALDYAARCFHLLDGEETPSQATLYRALWAEGHAMTQRSTQLGPRQNLRQVKRWLLRTRAAKPSAPLLLYAAEQAQNAEALPEAKDYWRRASVLIDSSNPDFVYLYDLLESVRALLLLSEKRYEAAIEVYIHTPSETYHRPLLRELFQADAFTRMGDKSSADYYLRRVYELITVLEADFYKTGADLCASRLERMT